MLVLLALLFANPFINRATPKAAGKKLVVVAVDNSFSMRATSRGQSRLDKAKQMAMDVISGIPATTATQVVALSGTVQAMTGQTNDPTELRGGVAAIQQTDGRGIFGELARFTRTLAESTKMPIELHLISDLQKSALPPGFTDLRLAGDTSLILHPVGGEIPNWTVESVNAPAHVYDPKRVHIQARIAGFGTPAAKRTVSLLLNGHVSVGVLIVCASYVLTATTNTCPAATLLPNATVNPSGVCHISVIVLKLMEAKRHCAALINAKRKRTTLRMVSVFK